MGDWREASQTEPGWHLKPAGVLTREHEGCYRDKVARDPTAKTVGAEGGMGPGALRLGKGAWQGPSSVGLASVKGV